MTKPRTLWLAAALWCCAGAAMAAITATLIVQPGPHAPGDSFTASLFINADEPTLGTTYALLAAELARLMIADRDLDGSPFTDPQTANVDGLAIGSAPTRDLGATVPDVFTPAPAGMLLLADYVLTIGQDATPGTYLLALAPGYSVALNADFESTAIFATAPVVIVPEPSALMLLGCLAGVRFRRRDEFSLSRKP